MATQTCDRTITGRNFNYAEALRIIQEEEYLADEDFDDIRLFHKQGEVIQAIENFEEKISDNKLVGQVSNNHIFDHSNELDPEDRKLESIDSELVEEFDWNILEREKRTIILGTVAPPVLATDTGFTLCNNFTNILCMIAPIITIFEITMMTNPAPTDVPSDQPQPGTPGGGDVPTGNEPILNFVPPGLKPVAVFPPFLPRNRRGRNAEAVIFKEEPGTVAGQNVGRRKRSFGYCPQPSFLDTLRKNIRCLGPRLKQKFGRKKIKPVNHYGYHGKSKSSKTWTQDFKK